MTPDEVRVSLRTLHDLLGLGSGVRQVLQRVRDDVDGMVDIIDIAVGLATEAGRPMPPLSQALDEIATYADGLQVVAQAMSEVAKLAEDRHGVGQ